MANHVATSSHFHTSCKTPTAFHTHNLIKEHWDFQSYNTNTEFVIEELLRPTNFANVTIPHKPNRAVIFDSALFHQTDKYQFKDGYENGRINLTFLSGDMKKGRGEGMVVDMNDGNGNSGTPSIDVHVKREL